MIAFLRHLIGWIIIIFRSRQDLILENLALRQQLLVLHTKRPRRRLPTIHKLFWMGLRRLWSRWNESLILVTPRRAARQRRTAAKLCRAKGGELEQIQFLLGHESILTTERYLGSEQNLKNAVNDALV